MKHISINISEAIQHILPDTLEKDLMDNEELCPMCHGLGVVADNYIYGIQGDTSEAAKKSMFPYNNQAIRFCPNCYNGIIRFCKYCGKQIQKNYIDTCDCEPYKEKQEEEKRIQYQQKIDQAQEMDVKEIASNTWLYDEQTNNYFPDIKSFIDSYKDYNEYKTEKEMWKNLPEVLWLCDHVDLSMDAASMIDYACEELHEDARNQISSEDENELQKFLDSWCKKQSGTKTFYPNDKKYVPVKKEWFASVTTSK